MLDTLSILFEQPAFYRESNEGNYEVYGIFDSITNRSVTIKSTASQDNLGERQKLFHYVQSLLDNKYISHKTAFFSWKFWKTISAEKLFIMVPDAAWGEQGNLIYTWDTKDHHFEAEFFPDERIEFFYTTSDLINQVMYELSFNDLISKEIYDLLDLFT